MGREGIMAVEVDGRTVRGSYRVERGIITVSSSAGSRSTEIGGSTAEQLARLLLLELAERA